MNGKKILSIIFLITLIASPLSAQPISLRDTTNQFDYIIITIPTFVTACEPFRQHKELVRNFRTLIVDTTQIFSEFDSSETRQGNIRDFISYAGTFWQNPKPENILILANLSAIPNFPDVFDLGGYNDTAYTDYKYSVNKYGSDSTLATFNIGRVPAVMQSEVTNYFNKVMTFESNTTYQPWMNQNLFVYHDFINPNATFLFEFVANSIMQNYPPYFTNYYYYAENDTSPHFGDRDSILNFLNTKLANSLWLIGGTSNTQFGYTSILDTGDIKFISNSTNCFITFFYLRQFFNSDTLALGLADKLLLSDEASVAVVAPVGLVYADQQQFLLEDLSQQLFGENRRSIGESINIVRNSQIKSYVKRMTNQWGDPSLIPKYDNTAAITNSVSIPEGFALSQNYPNPFNPMTTINYQIPNLNFVTLKIYDVLGSEVATLVSEEKPAGTYEITWNAGQLPSGIYFFRIQAGSFIETKKMILL
ncbi:MAG: C25 family cysteine peptidase, partial [Ignavibacteriaceae bacterium]|nr:C25 family cysteine peptidase [Ignavibacteriaceae bacterium]